MSPAKALRLALCRTSEVLWELALVTQGVQQEVLDQDGCIEMLAPGLLLVLMEGPEGARGLASFDREIMTGMIEIQTISKVTRMPIEDRPLTPTDAAMMAPLIDGTLERFESNLAGHPDLVQLSGFRFGAIVEDARTASLLLEAATFRAFRVTLDLDTGTRRGEIQIMLPEREISIAPNPTAASEPGPHEPRMMLVPAHIEAILARIRMPLSKASALRPGDLIELPDKALEKAELVAAKGHRLAAGRLGQMNGFRAIRLNLPPGIKRVQQLEAEADVEDAVMDFAAPPEEDIGELSFGGGMDLPETEIDLPGADFDFSEAEEDLPDLPALDFDTEFGGGGDFDFDADAMEEGGEDFPMAAMETEWDDK
ncbi:flagellar motor switch protein FliM [Puniceibacterium sediminis]|uniref:Flagellar motor switch protein FliM n=2 Tax=Puniceibacterium sediminis TaxID=1608407 RepID=A0A238XM86_9RHOB|nr:flagellar motor switch protein FliM [Puniceibacterium sediminis]